MQRLLARAPVMAAPRGLAVDGDQLGRVRPSLAHPTHEAGREHLRIHAVHQRAQPIRTGDALKIGQEAAQEGEMGLAPIHDVVGIIAGRDRAAYHQEQDLRQGVSSPPLLAPVSHRWCAPRFAETSFKADMIRRRVMMTTETAASGGVGLGRGGRMSRQRKRDAVLRLLRGEDLETLSRALGATAATLTGWQDTFVAAGEASLATRPTDGEALETERLKAKLGEMLLERELLEAKIAALEANRPLARRRSRR